MMRLSLEARWQEKEIENGPRMQTDGWTDGLAQHSLYHPVGRFFYLLSSSHIRFAWHDDDEDDDDADDAVASVCPLVGHESKRPMMKKSSRQLLSPSAIPTDASPSPNRLTTRRRRREDQSARPEVDCFSSDAFFPPAFSFSPPSRRSFKINKQTHHANKRKVKIDSNKTIAQKKNTAKQVVFFYRENGQLRAVFSTIKRRRRRRQREKNKTVNPSLNADRSNRVEGQSPKTGIDLSHCITLSSIDCGSCHYLQPTVALSTQSYSKGKVRRNQQTNNNNNKMSQTERARAPRPLD